jgi:hypothetical protein
MTEEQLNIEISLLINKTLYEQDKITYQEFLLTEKILLSKLNKLS